MAFVVQLEPCPLVPSGGTLQMHPGVRDVPELAAELGRQLRMRDLGFLVWDEDFEILSTGGHVPTDMIKHIYFEEDGAWKCFEFENVKPTKGWEEHEVQHNHNEQE